MQLNDSVAHGVRDGFQSGVGLEFREEVLNVGSHGVRAHGKACGDVAVRADPSDAEQIASGIEEAIRRRRELVPLGLAHSARFTWRAVGETFLRGYEEARAGRV